MFGQSQLQRHHLHASCSAAKSSHPHTYLKSYSPAYLTQHATLPVVCFAGMHVKSVNESAQQDTSAMSRLRFGYYYKTVDNMWIQSC